MIFKNYYLNLYNSNIQDMDLVYKLNGFCYDRQCILKQHQHKPWMEGRMDGRTNGLMDGLLYACTQACIHVNMHAYNNACMYAWMHSCTNSREGVGMHTFECTYVCCV